MISSAPLSGSEGHYLTVNWHIYPACNYKCRFCYQTFVDEQRWLGDFAACTEILRAIRRAGVHKVTFSGGEPTLHPHIIGLAQYAKEIGLSTSIVTNGTKITPEFARLIGNCLDVVAVSIDSSLESTEVSLGRGTGGHVRQALTACRLVKSEGIRLKVNTVVTKLNWTEDLRHMIELIAPERWKVFQFLPIAGENDAAMMMLSITKEEFDYFVATNSSDMTVPIFAENNDAMTESYIMIDPLGRVIQNSKGSYVRGPSLLDSSLVEAISEVGFDLAKFVNRGGSYR
jgi:radical S-adenosyl methionine domain-containing protein 2